MSKFQETYQVGEKICMGYMYGFDYPNCNYCTTLHICYPENNGIEESSRVTSSNESSEKSAYQIGV